PQVAHPPNEGTKAGVDAACNLQASFDEFTGMRKRFQGWTVQRIHAQIPRPQSGNSQIPCPKFVHPLSQGNHGGFYTLVKAETIIDVVVEPFALFECKVTIRRKAGIRRDLLAYGS